MSASHTPALDAIAFQLVSTLESHEKHVEEMVDNWLDMDLYRQVSDEVEEIRLLSTALPQLRVQWVDFLICHAELVHSLWRLRFRESDIDREKLQIVRERHASCLRSLQGRCLRLLSQDQRFG